MTFEGIGAFIGLVVGLIVAVLVIKLCNKNGKYNSQYDERQELKRGRGYKYAMISTWFMLAIYLILELGEAKLPVDGPLMLFTIIFISIMVQVSYSIWNDAYLGLNNKVVSYTIAFIVVAVINAIAEYRYYTEGLLVENGRLTWTNIHGECVIMMIIVGIEVLIKYIISKEEQEEN